MFDAVQWAHLHQHRNIGDAEVLLDIADALGHPRGAFADHMRSDAVRQRVQARSRRSRCTRHPLHSHRDRRQRPAPADPAAAAPAPGRRPGRGLSRTIPTRKELPMTPRTLATALACCWRQPPLLPRCPHDAASGQQVGTSPWGPKDEIGRLNLITRGLARSDPVAGQRRQGL
jgi:hypothetical protein